LGIRVERIGDAVLYLGDCREILPTLGKVDAVVTDPPYGIGIAQRGTLGSQNHAPVRDYGKSDWDNEPASAEIISQIQAISDYQIIFGGNFFSLPPSSCWLVWDKQNTGDYADCELAWTNLPQAVRRVYWRWNGMIRRGDDIREHPTQKPEGVMSWCLEQLPATVETILDPFMGSGTTGVAAIKTGKKFIGIEREPKYFEIALRRLSEARKQPDMFISRPEPAKQETFL
jgi:DNA modification methylase